MCSRRDSTRYLAKPVEPPKWDASCTISPQAADFLTLPRLRFLPRLRLTIFQFVEQRGQRGDVRLVGLRERLHVVLLGHLVLAPVAVEADALAAGVLRVERLVRLAPRAQAVGAAVGDHHAALGNRGAVQIDVDVAELAREMSFSLTTAGAVVRAETTMQLPGKEQRGDELVGGGRDVAPRCYRACAACSRSVSSLASAADFGFLRLRPGATWNDSGQAGVATGQRRESRAQPGSSSRASYSYR